MFVTILVAVAAASGSGSGTGNATSDPIGSERAVQLFRDICVSPLSNPDGFVAAMNSAGVRWTRLKADPAAEAFNGRTWRSPLGDVTYKQTGLGDQIIKAGAACNFAFQTDSSYSHDRAGALVSAAFGLGVGANSGTRKEQQTRWETQPVNGKFLRYFLTTRAPGARSEAILAVSERGAN